MRLLHWQLRHGLSSRGPRYFETLGIKVLRGRAFDAVDGAAGHQSTIINQRFAAMYFGTDDPIGRRIKLTADGPPTAGVPPPEWLTIVCATTGKIMAPSPAPTITKATAVPRRC